MANQIFCFQIKRTPRVAQFFPDCVIRNHLLRARAIFLVLENLLVLIYSKLHLKSCDYLYLKKLSDEIAAVGR